MSKFDYMEFTGGADGAQFVVHAKKYTKMQAVDLFVQEYPYCGRKLTVGDRFSGLRKPTIADIHDSWVRWYIKMPDDIFNEYPDGGYSFCSNSERGSFPVWVINVGEMKEEIA